MAPLLWILIAALGTTAAFAAFGKVRPPRGTPPKRGDLDPNLLPDEADAVIFAYQYEDKDTNLRDFGQSLRPEYPIASKALLNLSGLQPTMAANAPVTFTIPTGTRPAGSSVNLATSRISGTPRFIAVGFDLSDITDIPGDAWQAVTHPADTASGAWHAITHPADSFSDFGNGLVDALHVIPGMDEAGELLKKFARTDFGEWCLRVLATAGYYVMAPYLGAQLAAVSFALPGIAQAKPFVQAWVSETISRVIATIAILLPVLAGPLAAAAASAGGAALSEPLNKFLAENPDVQKLVRSFLEEIGLSVDQLKAKLSAAAQKALEDGATDAVAIARRELAQLYGDPPDFNKMAREMGIRADNAAAGYDLIAQTHYQTSIKFDPVTGQDIVAAQKERIGNLAVKDRRAGKQNLERLKWVLYYANQRRYKELLRKARIRGFTTGPSTVAVSGAPAFGGVNPAFPTLLPGNYRFVVRSDRYSPEQLVYILSRAGVSSLRMARLKPFTPPKGGGITVFWGNVFVPIRLPQSPHLKYLRLERL